MKIRVRWLLALLCALGLGAFAFGQAAIAAVPPYEFDSVLSLTGSCSESKADPVPDPGCPEKKPPKPFTNPHAIAIDSVGDEYVASYGAEEGKDGRIDVFGPQGGFITELKDPFGPQALAVDSKGNLYVWEEVPGGNSEVVRYSPTVYEPAKEKIEYGNPRQVIATNSLISSGGVAVDASNSHLFVDFQNKILEYSSAAEGNELKKTITNAKLSSSNFVAVDAARRRLYASACREGVLKCVVLVFNADTDELLAEIKGPEGPVSKGNFFSTKGWTSIAVDEETGNFFIGDLEVTNNVYQFNQGYEPLSTLTLPSTLFEGGEPMQIAVSNAPKGTKNKHYLFIPSLKGRALAYAPPKCQAPVVEAATATGIAGNEAELQAFVKPNGCATTYRFEYLSQQEYEEAGETFSGAKVAGEGTIQPVEQEAEVKAAIGGLEPGTEYRFRIVADNEVENAGKTEGGKDEEEAAFTTYNDASIVKECPEAVRNTYSVLLPDCRAYELVTPPDTNGRPPRGVGFAGDRFTTVETSPNGEDVSFQTEGGTIPGLGGSGAFNGSPYRSTRTPSGWTTSDAGPSGAEASLPSSGSTSPDQGYLFWTAVGVGSKVIEGSEFTHYVRYPDGRSELVGRGTDPEVIDPGAEGKLITENGTHIVFQTVNFLTEPAVQLEPTAPPTGTEAVYDRTSEEVTHVVSLLPGNKTPEAGEDAHYLGASEDGEGIVFAIGTTLYLRVANTTTYEIGTGVQFAGVSEGGKRAFYLEGGDLFALDTETEQRIRFTEVGNAVPVNVSADGARAYFVSTAAIPGSGENPNGATAIAPAKGTGTLTSGSQNVTGVSTSEGKFTVGQVISGTGIPAGTTITAVNKAAHTLTLSQKATASGAQSLSAVAENLYLSEEGTTIRFVGTVTERDVVGEKDKQSGGQVDGLGLWSEAVETGRFAKEPSRTTPDGTVLLFSSRADLTGYSHEGVPELYRYDSAGGRLHCISCIPTKAPASGGASLESARPIQEDPQPFSDFGYVPNLRADGKRIVFQSNEALVSTDNDETQDVYEWEEEGVGSCTRAGGCVYLISSGHSASPNYLYGISSSGNDIFFITSDVLAGGDDSTQSIYDARVNGGFPEPVEKPCEGEGCKPNLTPPPLLTEPGVPALGAEDNVPTTPKHCPKGKRKVKRHDKTVCVKKHHRKHHANKKGAGK